MHRLSVMGILVGGIVDILAANVVALVVFTAVALATVAAGGAPANQSAFGPTLLANPIVMTPVSVCGAIASILGGYVAARLARHDELLNGASSAWLCIASGLIGTALAHHGNRPLEILILPISPVLGFSGGYLWRAQKTRRTPATA